MLKQRIITALVLLPIALGGFFLLEGAFFALFIGAVVSLGAWEWARLAGYEQQFGRVAYAATVAVLMVALYHLPQLAGAVLLLALVWWTLATVLVLTYPESVGYWGGRWRRLGMGLLILLPAWQGLVLLKQWPLANGLIIAVMVLVWGADIGAYFSGKAFGKRKLAPRVSPGKSWEGGGVRLDRRRPHRKHVQAPVRNQGQQQPAARPRWRAGSHRQPDGSHPGIRGPALGRRLGCAMSRPQRISVLGATGSIGLSTLDVVQRHPDRYEAFALTGFSRLAELEALCLRHRPVYAVVPEQAAAIALQGSLAAAGIRTRVLFGEQALCEVASAPEVDMVMAAIVGAAGLPSTLAAVEAGKRVLLANKEALVMSGALFMQAVKRSGAVLLPIDSEHNAIFQSLPRNYADGLERVGVRRILLTASGGPFRETPLEQLASVTPEQACAHPNWSMGRKISVDSASMMNKGLELIEACWLFDAQPSQVEVVIHPQSVIHSMVDYVDGSVIAQLGNPDMRTPISYAMAWPERIDSGVSPLDMFAVGRLDFQRPDEQRFPCLRLASQAAETGGSAPAMLNAANEVAVAAFLERRIRFSDIAVIIEDVLNREAVTAVESLDQVLAADRRARSVAGQWLTRHAG